MLYVVNLSLKGNNYSVLITPDTFETSYGVKRGSRYGRGIRLAYNHSNYARWWNGFGRKHNAYCFGPFKYCRYVSQATHISLGKFCLSILRRRT